MKVRVNKRISDSDTKSLFDDIDVVMSVFGDIHVSRFYSDDNTVTLVADYDVWSDNARQIKQEMKNLGYSLINAGGSDRKIMLDFQKIRTTDSRKKQKTITDMAREIKVYTFDELSDEAKKNAIDSMCYKVAEDLNAFDADDFRATVKAVCEVFNAESYGQYLTDLHYRGDNYDEYADEDGNETAETVRQFVEDRLQWGGIDIENDWQFTGTYADDAACKYIEQVMKGEKTPESIDEFIKELGEEIHYQWEQQEDANTDDEVVADFLSANNYEFLESGKPLN